MTLLAPRISWKSRGRLTGLALLLAGFTFVNGGQYDASAVARTGLAPEPEIISDWEITSFQAAARQHLDRFFQSVR